MTTGRRRCKTDATVFRYAPNRVRKTTWTEAGPPAPRSDKTPCPRDLGGVECSPLLAGSVAEEVLNPRSRRYAVRRSEIGLEVFAGQAHSPSGQEPIEFHGYPVASAPARVLRALRDRGDLAESEYKRLVRGLS